MAVVRARSAPPYGLIAFVALFFIAAAAAVLMYIQYGKTNTELENLRRQYGRVASQNEATQIPPSLAADQSPDKSTTAVGSAVSQINGFKTLIGGAASGTYMDAVGKAQSALKAAGRERESLADAVSSLATERDGLKKSLDDARNQLNTINTQVTNAGTQATERVNALQKDIDDLRKQLGAANDAIAKGNEARDIAVAKGEGQINNVTTQAEDERRKHVLELDAKNAEIAKLNDKVKQLQLAMQGKGIGAGVADVGQPDGEVLRVNPATNELMINLGEAARIQPGLTFTVFDPRTGVRYGTDELAAGKGSIEVIRPGKENQPSLCRITHQTKGQSIQAGDIISNVVFHNTKERKTHFTIVGDFDLDGDGFSTADERQRLITLVTSWGGAVDDQVTTQTDYLVTGLPPAPGTLSTAEAATQGSTQDERAKERKRFDDAITEAKSLSIPTLNANRFLSMIGYYSTTIVR